MSVDRRTLTLHAIAFVVVAALVVVGAAAIGATTGSTGTQTAESSTSYAPEASPLADRPEEGSVTMDESGDTKTVVVDLSHDNVVEKEEIQPLIDALAANGHRVVVNTGSFGGAEEFNSTLRSADALVVVAPTQEYTPAEVRGVRAFTDAGGRLLLAAEPTRLAVSLFGGTEQSDSRLTTLGTRYGFSFSTGYLYNMHENDGYYRNVVATPTGDAGDLGDGVDRVVAHGAVRVGHSTPPALTTGERTFLSTSRRSGQYAVAARNGNVTAVGDVDLFAANQVHVADNEAFVGNVADFLVSGDKTEGIPAGADVTEGFGGGFGDGGFGGGDTGDTGNDSETGNGTDGNGTDGNGTAAVALPR